MCGSAPGNEPHQRCRRDAAASGSVRASAQLDAAAASRARPPGTGPANSLVAIITDETTPTPDPPAPSPDYAPRKAPPGRHRRTPRADRSTRPRDQYVVHAAVQLPSLGLEPKRRAGHDSEPASLHGETRPAPGRPQRYEGRFPSPPRFVRRLARPAARRSRKPVRSLTPSAGDARVAGRGDRAARVWGCPSRLSSPSFVQCHRGSLVSLWPGRR